MAIVSLRNVTVSFGDDVVLHNVDLQLHKGDRLCLTGRNGSGKSTLLRLIEGELNADEGQIWRAENLAFSSLEQELPTGDEVSVFKAVASGYEALGELLVQYHNLATNLNDDGDVRLLSDLQERIEAGQGWSINHRIESVLDRMGLDPDKQLSELSGGWLKRVAIAKSLVSNPEVWLLDEPTNHLDIPTIQWLEEQLLSYEGTIVFVSHDRQLMQSVATSIIDIDRGTVTRWECDYQTFLVRREQHREVEERQNRKFDSKLMKEEAWIRQGIKARRTRNEGRVRALALLRNERAQRKRSRTLRMEIDAGISSGKIVKELHNVSKSFGDAPLIDDFSFILQRGDRVGLVGPNGAGKTTLLRILLDGLAVDKGQVRTGTKLSTAYFDQTREQLDPEQSVADYISEGREFIRLGNKDIHVVSYLGNFMFSADQARAPIRTLSGGEQNRLLLARLFSLPANLLVLDEPTNDLDVESLELLEELLLDFKGTVLIVSHDRSFMDNVVSSLLVFEGNGVIHEIVGGYSDWISSGGGFQLAPTVGIDSDIEATKVSKQNLTLVERKKLKSERQRLEKELARLPEQIEADEKKLSQLHHDMSSEKFYQQTEEEKKVTFDQVKELESGIEKNMQRWEEFEQKLSTMDTDFDR